MSLDSFASDASNSGSGSSATSSEEPEEEEDESKDYGTWEERFYGEDMNNTPPQEEVDELQVVDIEAIQDEDLAADVAENWSYRSPEKYSLVIKLYFNDGRTWHWAFKEIDGAKNSHLSSFLRRWISRLLGEEWEYGDPENKPNWDEYIRQTEWDSSDRKEMNKQKDWCPYIGKKVKSKYDDVEVDDGDGYDWMDDW